MKNIHYISAGAGSGKTYTLTEIMAERIADGFCRPDEIMLTTFTVAAANEFREKARHKLIDKGLVEQAAEMSGARIGTIHSVAKSLIDRYWYRLELVPGMKVLSDEERLRHINESLATLASKDELKLFNSVRDCFGIVSNNGNSMQPDRDFWKRHLETIVFLTDNYQELSLDESLEYCRGLYRQVFDDGQVDVTEVLSGVRAYLEEAGRTDGVSAKAESAIRSFLRLELADEFYYHLFKASSVLKALPKKLIGKDPVRHQELCDAVNRCLRQSRYASLLDNYAESIFSLAVKWREYYAEYKRRNALIDYNDMERYMLQLLGDSEVAEEISNTTKLVLVDEFQDCSPMQILIFDRLAEIVKSSVWVGDTKQSIYGFRKSDPEMVDMLVSRFPQVDDHSFREGVSRSSLPKSYRSRERLVRATNAIFEPVFGPGTALQPHNGEENLQEIPPLVHWLVNGDVFEAVADGVEEMINNGVSPGEIAILTRTNSKADAMAAALRNRGIEVASADPDIRDYMEVQLLVALINYAVLHDDFSKAVILALMADCSVEEILDRRLNHIADKGNDPWLASEELFRKIDRVIDRNFQQSISGFVESLIVELDFENMINRWSGREYARRQSHLDSILTMAANYEMQYSQSGVASLGGFAHCLEQGQAPEQPFIKDKRAVSALTYHKSKGLEWEHVIMTELDNNPFSPEPTFFNRQLFNVQMHTMRNDHGGATKRVISICPELFGKSSAPESIADTLRRVLRSDDVIRRTNSEDARLLYVGFTRASRQVITVQKHGKRKDDSQNVPAKPLEWLKRTGIGSDNKIWSNCTENIVEKRFVGEPGTSRNNDKRAVKYERGSAAECQELKYIQPSMLRANAEGRQTQVEIVMNDGARIDIVSGQDVSMSELGTTIHNIMAIYDPVRKDMKERADRIVMRHGLNEIIEPGQVLAAAEKLYAYLQKEYGKAVNVYRERPVRMWYDGRELTGSIDLVWETENGCIVVDYKSFPGSRKSIADSGGEHYAGMYAPQLKSYRKVLEAADITVIDTLIYYVVQGCIVRLS